MLVVISDLHLADSSCGATVPSAALALFARQLHQLVFGASWRADDRYRPLAGVDVVLLGDCLDLLRSRSWLRRDDVRPWTDTTRVEMSDTVSKITSDILRVNQEAISILKRLTLPGGLTVPAASQRGRPSTEEQVDVPLRLHYMVGNHDWFLHLPGQRYGLLRQIVIEQMGLTADGLAPLAHDPEENEQLLDLLRQHRVLARHGDVFDPLAFSGDRDQSSLADLLIVELLNQFTVKIEDELSGELPLATLMGLRDLECVRPLPMVPVWIDGLLERTCPQRGQRQQVRAIWDALVERLLQSPALRRRDGWNPADIVDGLERILKFSKQSGGRWLERVHGWLADKLPAGEGMLYRHALAEQDFRNRRAKHIVYGHTHRAESIPLEASYAGDYVLPQMYFNTGTWRRVYRPTQLAGGPGEFIPHDELSYLCFYQGDERSGRCYESWTGQLGVAPPVSPIYRIDAAETHEPHRAPLTQPTRQRVAAQASQQRAARDVDTTVQTAPATSPAAPAVTSDEPDAETASPRVTAANLAQAVRQAQPHFTRLPGAGMIPKRRT